jgi:hypothetical protein
MGTGNYIGQAVFSDNQAAVTATWNSSTANNTSLSLATQGYGTVEASVQISGTISAGAINFEVSDDGGTTWWPITGVQTGSFSTNQQFPLSASSNTAWQFAIGAFGNFRIRLSPAITGSGSVTVLCQAESMVSTQLVVVGQSAGTNLVVSGTVTANQGGAPWSQNVTQWNSVALGSPSNFGTSPGAVSVPGHNASIFAGTTALTATGSSLNVNITGGSSSGTQYTNGTAVSSGSLVGTEALGYDAFYMSGGNTSAHQLGWPDSGTSMRDMVDNARKIVLTVQIPVFADADTGYGDAISTHYTVREYIQAGIAGAHIEDQTFPPKSGPRRRCIPIRRWSESSGRRWTPNRLSTRTS